MMLAHRSCPHDCSANSKTTSESGKSPIDPLDGSPLRPWHTKVALALRSGRRAGKLTPFATVGVVLLGILCLIVWLMLPLRPKPGAQPAALGAKPETVRQPGP